MKYFFENCDPARMKLKSDFQKIFQLFEKAFFSWESFCVNYCGRLLMFKDFHFTEINQASNRRRNWIDHYFTKRLCSVETLRVISVLVDNYILFQAGFQEGCESYDKIKTLILNLLHSLSNRPLLKNICYWCSQQSHGVTKELCPKHKNSLINGHGVTACKYLEFLESIWFSDRLVKSLLNEQETNRTITEYCSGTVNKLSLIHI